MVRVNQRTSHLSLVRARPVPIASRKRDRPHATRVHDALVAAVSSVVAGNDDLIEMVALSLLSGGHVLVEEAPGSGKTLIAQAFAQALGGTSSRIQGTPDLLPSDVTGQMLPDGDDMLMFHPGPVFANVVLFDEMNRCSPRTQSALLEATEEASVTVDGDTHELPDPFLLVATQNPLTEAGTFPLPSATLDRFSVAVSPPASTRAEQIEVFVGRRGRHLLDTVAPVTDPVEVSLVNSIVDGVDVSDDVAGYVADLLAHLAGMGEVTVPPSTRAGVATVQLARAAAAVAGRQYVTVDDVTRVAPFTLGHRLGAAPISSGHTLVADALAAVPVPRR